MILLEKEYDKKTNNDPNFGQLNYYMFRMRTIKLKTVYFVDEQSWPSQAQYIFLMWWLNGCIRLWIDFCRRLINLWL